MFRALRGGRSGGALAGMKGIMGYEMRQMQAFRGKGQILENRCYLEVQVSYITGIFEAGFKGRVLPGQGGGWGGGGQVKGNR